MAKLWVVTCGLITPPCPSHPRRPSATNSVTRPPIRPPRSSLAMREKAAVRNLLSPFPTACARTRRRASRLWIPSLSMWARSLWIGRARPSRLGVDARGQRERVLRMMIQSDFCRSPFRERR